MFAGPQARLEHLTEDTACTMLLRDVQFLEQGKLAVKFLGCMLSRVGPVSNWRRTRAQLIEDIASECGMASSTRGGAVAGMKERVLDETPLDAEEHAHYRR